jgi:hypothetical protein
MAQKTKVKNQSLGIMSGARSGSKLIPTKAKPQDNSDLTEGKIAPVGTGLTLGEKAALKAIAESNQLTLNALMRFALRRFIVEVRSGKIDLEAEQAEPEPQKKRLKLPS